MVNKVEVLGRLGADPEVRTLENGTVLARVSVGTNKVWMDKNNQKQEETSWHNITMFGKLAENAQRILQKGSLVYVEGELKYRTVEKDGLKTRYTDINARDFRILTDGRRNENSQTTNDNNVSTQNNYQGGQTRTQVTQQPQATQQTQVTQQTNYSQPQNAMVGGTDDDLPF